MLINRYHNKRLIVQEHVSAILNLPAISKGSHATLRQLLDDIQKHIRALKSLKRPTEHWDDLLIQVLTKKLDVKTFHEWEDSLSSEEIPTFEDIIKFLTRKCNTLAAISKQVRNDVYRSKICTNAITSNVLLCSFCDGDHLVYKCAKLLSMSVEQRIQKAKAKKLCLNCLKARHQAFQCKSGTCKVCNKKHNSLLHVSSNPNPSSSTKDEESVVTVSNYNSNLSQYTHVLLSTAVVNILDSDGREHICRVLLDSGSQSNIITRKLADALKLSKTETRISITGVNQAVTNINYSVQVTIKSQQSGFTADLNCLILDKISQRMPIVSISREKINIPKNIRLADPHFHLSRDIDLLIGVEVFYNLLCVGQINLGQGQPCLQKTLLGWLVSGKVTANEETSSLLCNVTNIQLNENIVKFWEIEDVSKQSALSLTEKRCEEHFMRTTQINSDNRFVVSLPFKENPTKLGKTYDQALKRFHSLERKLNRNPELKREYILFMKEYEDLGHMQLVENTNETFSTPHFYLPHHAVVKENSLTTKVRVVFDGSAKSTTGVSLNDILLVGPKLQEDLFDIVARFRIHKYVLTANIAKMYRQVMVTREHTPFQRILWRENENDEIKTYELNTVTYGTASASYLAIKALQQLAHNQSNTFPLGSNVILRDFYVDDLLTGADTLQDVLNIRQELISILSYGKMELRKWSSNEQVLLRDLSNSSNSHVVLSADKIDDVNTLGLLWNSKSDILQYSAVSEPLKNFTKRNVLSQISKIFDPLGLIAPLTIRAKMLMQEIWQSKLHWDESLPLHIQDKWLCFTREQKMLSKIHIPRRVVSVNNPACYEIHGVCDASEKAYGACIYIRTTNTVNDISCHLLCAKSKVAPLKATTLPRLELCGALLLARVMDRLKKTLRVSNLKAYYWTDSKIVLSWIQSPSKTWKTFVANRVGEIHELSEPAAWRHVSTNHNPADVLSRGSPISLLKDNELWWSGPEWLKQEDCKWPITASVEDAEAPERKEMVVAICTQTHTFDLFERYSSLSRLVRITAYCQRFVSNCRARQTRNKIVGPLSTSDLNTSMTTLIKITQASSFPKEIHQLTKNGKLNNDSRLLSLNPFIDNEGVLRVGGRLHRSNIAYQYKHQSLLPAKHRLTELIIQNEHTKQLHAGTQLTMAAVRLKYWPLSLRNSVKAVIHKCVMCFKAKPVAHEYLMGNLPSNRVNPARPFQHVGVDYFGPVQLKESRRRNSPLSKAYGAIFVCLATKAVHIELVGDLTAAGFLAAFRRFVGRRGKVSNIYSDNGTQFVGASKELKRLMTQFLSQSEQNKIKMNLTQEGTNWHFIPPRSPHFGGIWEAAVKSVKHHLVRTLGNSALNYEEFYTLLIQIEALLNSRPLTPLSNDPNDLTFLTPSHFLTGDVITQIPESHVLDLRTNSLSRWQYVQRLRAHYWKRWSREYLHYIQIRTKWKTNGSGNLTPGRLVLLKEDNIPPEQWPTGRVEKVFIGDDGVVRAASIKTASGVYKRAVTKLCILPIDT